MLKLTTRFITVALTALVIVTSLHAGGTSRTVDARSILTAAPQKDASLQATAFSKPLNLQREAAEHLFAERPRELQLTNFPIPGRPDATLTLHRTRDVIDASSEIYIGTKDGPRRITIRPITSYFGTLNEDPDTRVSLHYSTDDLTGMIHMADGSRLIIGRDAGAVSVSAVPHSIAIEGALEGGSLLKNFTCGTQSPPITIETLERVAKDAQTEVVQNGYLKQIRVALEIQESIDIEMKRRGFNDEQILQYVAKVWATVSQVYEQELNATVFLSYIYKYSEDDPSPYPGNGLDPPALLGEFATEWRQRQDPPRTLAHIMTLSRQGAAGSVGGVGYGARMESNLCNPTGTTGSYSVSTMYTNASDIPGLPTRSNGFVWDVFVIAHEMGHNVGASHTHNCVWNPPLDSCQVQEDNTDGCVVEASKRRPRAGTIMSYCHLVNGSSTPLTFGPARVTSLMAQWIAGSPCVTAPPDPTVHITSPRGSETWNSGQNVDILWVSDGVTNVKLQYSADEGGEWTEIVPTVPASDKKFAWTVPAVATTRLLIRISDVENPNVNHISLATFTISAPQLPKVSLIKPVGGERLRQGSQFTITWTRLNVGNVTIDFAPDGTTWEILKADTASTSYSWQVPNITTSNAKIRVRSSDDPNVASTSGDIAIGALRFELLKPTSGDTLCQLFDNGFIWSGDFVSRIKIRYSTDGVTMKNAIIPVSVPVGPGMLISAPSSSFKLLPVGTVIQLHIIDDGTDSVLVTVTGMIAGSCDQPNSVAGDVVTQSDLTIVGVTPSPASQSAVLTLSTSRAMTLEVLLVDMVGNSTTLLSNVHVEGNGMHYINLPLQTAASGAYMVSVRAGGFQVSTSLRIAR